MGVKSRALKADKLSMKKVLIILMSIITPAIVISAIKLKAHKRMKQEACDTLKENLKKSSGEITSWFELHNKTSHGALYDSIGHEFFRHSEHLKRIKQKKCFKETTSCLENLNRAIKASKSYGQACLDYSESRFLQDKFPESLEVMRQRINSSSQKSFYFGEFSGSSEHLRKHCDLKEAYDLFQ